MPRPVEALPCGSRSITSTRWPSAASAVPRLIAVVVLPTPPFWLAMARTCGSGRSSGTGDRSDFHDRRLGIGPAGVDPVVEAPARARRRRSPYAPSAPLGNKPIPAGRRCFSRMREQVGRAAPGRGRRRRRPPAAAAPRCAAQCTSTASPRPRGRGRRNAALRCVALDQRDLQRPAPARRRWRRPPGRGSRRRSRGRARAARRGGRSAQSCAEFGEVPVPGVGQAGPRDEVDARGSSARAAAWCASSRAIVSRETSKARGEGLGGQCRRHEAARSACSCRALSRMSVSAAGVMPSIRAGLAERSRPHPRELRRAARRTGPACRGSRGPPAARTRLVAPQPRDLLRLPRAGTARSARRARAARRMSRSNVGERRERAPAAVRADIRVAEQLEQAPPHAVLVDRQPAPRRLGGRQTRTPRPAARASPSASILRSNAARRAVADAADRDAERASAAGRRCRRAAAGGYSAREVNIR